MTNILGELGNLASAGPDVVLTALETVINAIGEGTEWTGEQIAKLGELEEQLASKVGSLRGGQQAQPQGQPQQPQAPAGPAGQ